jgi:hypothetical protein
MPLYPLVAVLVGVVVERCSSAAWKTYPRRAWHQFLLLWSFVIGAIAISFAAASILPVGFAERFHQPRWFCAAYSVLAVITVFCLWLVYRRANKFQPMAAILAIAAVAGLGVAGMMVNVNTARWNNPADVVANLKDRLPNGARLVSFSPVEHRFVYYFQNSVAELDWPTKLTDAPIDTDYFCFMRHPADTAASRISGRGRTPYTTPGTLPFAWEEITSICVERQLYNDDPRTVVLGRIVRPLRPVVSDVTVPQSLARASTTAPNTRSTERSRMQR